MNEDKMKIDNEPILITLLPREESKQPYYIPEDKWHQLCCAAGLDESKREFAPEDCQKIAKALRENPKVIDFQDGGMNVKHKEAIGFFDSCGGIRIPKQS